MKNQETKPSPDLKQPELDNNVDPFLGPSEEPFELEEYLDSQGITFEEWMKINEN